MIAFLDIDGARKGNEESFKKKVINSLWTYKRLALIGDISPQMLGLWKV